MINEVCNLRCKYCFANRFVNPEENKDLALKKQIEIDDFKEIVHFITKTRSDMGLLGGEPTLHPKINELLDYLDGNEKVKRVTIFTNGISLEKIIDNICESKKLRLLVNLNSPEDIGEKNYAKVIANIDEFHSRGYNRKVLLGVNIYKEDFDYGYLIEALKRYGHEFLRVAIIAPNSEEMRRSSYLDYCKKIKPVILSLFRNLYNLKISPRFDCPANVIPPCLLTDEEKKFMIRFAHFIGEKYIYEEGIDPAESKTFLKSAVNITNFPHCSPIIDFTINKKAIRCFPLHEEEVDMRDFKDMNELIGYFKNRYDVFAHLIPIDEKCRDCRHMKAMSCQGGCLAYKTKEINEAREKVANIKRHK